ncbi:MAG: nucleotidyltransferase family protein [Oscillospiraceae bacterium]|nr:nucleotidyltransferase family protein [Oscillospiraceae bacterium]
MTDTFHDMLYLFACGATGKAPVLNRRVDIAQIKKLSMKQGIWPTVILALKAAKQCSFFNVSESEMNALNDEMIAAAAKNIQRLSISREVFSEFNKAGISYCLLKGESLAALYNEPSCRISGDTDILIPIEKETECVAIMEKLGYSVPEKSPTSHHICCHHPIGGLVELHLRLYDELFEDVWFNNKMFNQEPYRKINLDENIRVPVLGITDGYIFTALHFIKHFLSRGAGVRQMMDTLLYAINYKNEIDWNRVNQLMRYLKYDRFMDCVYQIGAEYCKLPVCVPDFQPVEDGLHLRVLEDMETGGVFGQSQKGRENFFYRYTQARFETFKKNENYQKYMNDWKRQPLVKRLFPSRKAIFMKYPYVQKSVLLLPAAWVHRIIDLLIRVLTKKRKMSELYRVPSPDNDIVEKRMDLIKDLNMI